MASNSNQSKNVRHYCSGGVLRGSKSHTIIFQFLGRNYTTTKNRKKLYGLDNYTWQRINYDVWTKLAMIIGREVKHIK